MLNPASLPDDQQILLQRADSQQLKTLAYSALSRLAPDDKTQVAAASGVLQPPDPGTTNVIWVTIVAVFGAVMVGAAAALFVGHFILVTPATGAVYTPTETLVTLFTTASAFLAGLLVRSPVTKG